MNTELAVEIVNLSKSFCDADEEHVVFNDLSLSIAAREFLVLLGRSGSGKSTLLNLISGIDQTDQGQIVVNGTAVNELSETQRTLFRRHHIGFVFQFYNLIPTLTVEENLLLPLELIRRTTPADRRSAQDLLDRLELGNRRLSFPDRLSGGEQQRVAIARALIHDPPLVLADEPTGNLDLETGKIVLKLLDDLVRETGKTLVMVTHGHEVVGVADRVLTIHDGKLEDSSLLA